MIIVPNVPHWANGVEVYDDEVRTVRLSMRRDDAYAGPKELDGADYDLEKELKKIRRRRRMKRKRRKGWA